MQAELANAVATQYPSPRYVIEPLKTTRHLNVVRIHDTETDTHMVAKGIFHIEDDANLGPAAMNRGFEVETEVLSDLPPWWGIHLVAAFRVGDIRIVVTPELTTHSWLSYKPSLMSDRAIAAALGRQLRYLHSQHIAHRDLELKNVLLTTGFVPVIIDFEKATLEATAAELRTDWEKLVGSLREYENTRRIGVALAAMGPLERRHSIGGYWVINRNRRSRRSRRRRLVRVARTHARRLR